MPWHHRSILTTARSSEPLEQADPELIEAPAHGDSDALRRWRHRGRGAVARDARGRSFSTLSALIWSPPGGSKA